MAQQQLISISDILRTDYEKQNGDYIEVNTVWTSEISADTQKACSFIFTDQLGCHIGGVLFLNDGKNTDARNVFGKLQNKSCRWKITHFKCRDITEAEMRIISKNEREIIIQPSTLYVNKAPIDGMPLVKHLPSHFVKLDEVDNQPIGSLIDVIGYVKKVAKDLSYTNTKGQQKYNKITISSSRSSIAGKGFERDIALFNNLAKESVPKNSVFVLLNVEVSEWERGSSIKNKSLKSSLNTIMFKLQDITSEQLSPDYRNVEFVKDLFPKRRAKNNKSSSRDTSNAPQTPPAAPQVENIPTTPPSTSDSSTSPPPPPISPYVPDDGGYYTEDYIYQQELQQSRYTPTMPSFTNGNCQILSTSNESVQYLSISNGNLSSKRSSETEPTSSTITSKRPRAENFKRSLSSFPEKIYDFIKNPKALNVQENTQISTYFMDDKNAYPMRSYPRGIALIINNYLFESTNPRVRRGSHKDVEYLSELFKIFKFTVTVKENKTAEEMPKIIASFKQLAKSNMDACFVAILSHGRENLVETVDNKYFRLQNDIIHQFDSKAFPVFADKPKIFLVQTCQNNLLPSNSPEIYRQEPERVDSPELENMIVCYASAFGTSANRDVKLGSHFIYVFVDTLMEHACDTDLETMLNLVQCRMMKMIHPGSLKQNCFWTTHNFFKDMYFNPGLPNYNSGS